MTSLRRRPKTVLSLALLAAVVSALALAASAIAHPFHPGADFPTTSSNAYGGLRLDRVGTFAFPVYVTAPRGDTTRQFVVEQSGQIRVIKNGQTLSRPFLDLSSVVGFDQGERGLLSMAFAPDYAKSGLFYVDFNLPNGDIRVEEFRRSATNPDLAAPTSRRKVIEIDHERYGNHNGGQLQFRWSTDNLFVSTGDGGGGGDPLHNGQNLDSLLGKILRIDVRHRSDRGGYAIPGDNPFVGRAGRNEIWHYGLRNPWRFSFDRANGNMAIGDVGQGNYEEVDFVGPWRSGANFGWNCFEGLHPYSGCSAPGHVPPVLEYSHEGASCSITGGYVLRDRSVSRLGGRYIYGDYCTGALHAATLRVGQRTPSDQNNYLGLVVPRLTGFGEDAQGRLYMTSRSYDGRPGGVYRLRAAAP